MYLKLENKLPHLNQLFHVLYGFAIITLFQFLNPGSASNVHIFATKLSFLVLSFSMIVYVWWRQLELYQIGYMRKPGYVIFAFARIFVLFFLLFFARNVLGMEVIGTVALQQFTISVFVLCLIALVQDALIIRPTYGKERVFIRRELWQDIFLAAISLVWFALLSTGFTGRHDWSEFGVVIIAVLLVRPLARMLTRWKELEPPHRGGRRMRSDQRSGQRGSRGGRGTRPESKQRSESSSRSRQPRSSSAGSTQQRQNRSSVATSHSRAARAEQAGSSRTGARQQQQQAEPARQPQSRQQSRSTASQQAQSERTSKQQASGSSAQPSRRRSASSRRAESKTPAVAPGDNKATKPVETTELKPEQKTADLGSSSDAAADQPTEQPVRKLRTPAAKPQRQTRQKSAKSTPKAETRPEAEKADVAAAVPEPEKEKKPAPKPVREKAKKPALQPEPETVQDNPAEEQKTDIVYGRKGTRKTPKLPDTLEAFSPVEEPADTIKVVPDEIPETAFGRKPKKKSPTVAPAVKDEGEKGDSGATADAGETENA